MPIFTVPGAQRANASCRLATVEIAMTASGLISRRTRPSLKPFIMLSTSPARPLRLGRGERLRRSMSGGSAIASWPGLKVTKVTRSPASDQAWQRLAATLSEPPTLVIWLMNIAMCMLFQDRRELAHDELSAFLRDMVVVQV